MGKVTATTILSIIAGILLAVTAIFREAIYRSFDFASFCTITMVLFVAIMVCLVDFGVADLAVSPNLEFLKRLFWRGFILFVLGMWYFPALYKTHQLDGWHTYLLGFSKYGKSTNYMVSSIIGFVVDVLGLVIMIIGIVNKDC